MNQTRKQILDLLLYFRANKELVVKTFKMHSTKYINNYLSRDEVRKSVKCSNGQDNKVLSLHDDVSKQTLLEFVNGLPDDSLVTVFSFEDSDGFNDYNLCAKYLTKEDDYQYLYRLQGIKDTIYAKDHMSIKNKVKDTDVLEYIKSLEKKLGM